MIKVSSKGHDLLVSHDGEIYSTDRQSSYTRQRNGKAQEFTTTFKSKKLSKYIAKNGYYEVASMHNGVRKKHLVHRLVGKALVEGYSEELTINHIDGNKLNNNPSNLEWVSLADNTKHEWSSGLVNLRGDNNPNRKLSSKQVLYIRKTLQKGISCNTLSIIAGVCPSTIYLIRDGKRWREI